MGAHAVAYFKNPANNTEKKAGYYVAVYLQIRNDGNEQGNFYFGIKKNGVGCQALYNIFLNPGAAKNCPSCTFTMPDSRVTINYFGGHAESGAWKQDFSDTIYIDPEAPVIEYCSQTFRVVDQNGVGVAGARIHLTNSKNEYLSTNSSGYVTFNNLQKNRTHYADAGKSGYATSSSISFTACTSTRTLTITKSCSCGSWVNRECVRDNYRRQTRTCTPSGCDMESREVLDASCYIAPPKGEFVGEPTYPSTAKAGATIKVSFTIRNSGGEGASFEVRPKDQKGVVYPGSGFSWLGAGSSKNGEVYFYMPNYDIVKGQLQLIMRT